ncbi:hypothetical protein MCUN1_003827 [Malassezia cuniculi]|uniref:Uncharacterized protein n=1 Tax=Malassezia cuniculi TaxID=948313 RepID=A0AAF0EXM4_9BASI|nr:hypothetical protein MCUN1_003827 [Malassezia cuniculi]
MRLDQSGTFHLDASVGLASEASLLPPALGTSSSATDLWERGASPKPRSLRESDTDADTDADATETHDTEHALDDDDHQHADTFADDDQDDAFEHADEFEHDEHDALDALDALDTQPESPGESARTPLARSPERRPGTRPPRLGRPLEPGLDDIDASLSASLRATHLPGDIDEMLEDEDIETPVDRSVSGQWGVKEMRRRTAAGMSARSAQQKIDQLTAERDDLKIEVDFHRRKMSPDDVSAELITLRQEKLSYVRRLQKLNELVKRQDQALKSVNQQVKEWEHKLNAHEDMAGALAAAEARARSAEDNARALERRLDSAASEASRHASAQLESQIGALQRALESRDAELEETRAALDDAEAQLGHARGQADESVQRQLDEQQETICTLQDALAAERLAVAAKDGELDRAESELEALHHDAAAEIDELRRQLSAQQDAADEANTQLGVLNEEVQRLEEALREAHTYHEGLNHALKDKLSRSTVDADEELRRLDADLADARAERDGLRAELDERAAEVADLEALNERLNAKVHELVADLKDEEREREKAASEAASRASERDARSRRLLAAKDAHIEQLESQIAAASTATPGARRETERAAARLEARVRLLEDELAARDEKQADAESEAAKLRAESRELAGALQDATHTRLALQDRVETLTAALDDARDEIDRLRSSGAERPAASASSSGRATERAVAAERAAAERASLLVTVYEALAHALNDETRRPDISTFNTFSERLMGHVRKLAALRASFEVRIKQVEEQAGQETRYVVYTDSALRRQQELRMAQLERVEKTIRAATEKQAQWRQRVAERDDELQTLRRANTQLQLQLSRLKSGGTASAHVGSEGPAWAARLRELEARVREADERVKRERAGARERAARDDALIRQLQALAELRDGQ